MKRLVLFVLSVLSVHAANTIAIQEKSGATQTNFPVTIHREFVQGEIAACPLATLSVGGAVTTQTDNKSLWPDTTLQQADVSFVIPSLAANSTVTATFTNQSCPSNTGQLTRAQMLAVSWGAEMDLTNGTLQTANAITILTAWDGVDGHVGGRYWRKGPVTTQIILEDRTSAFTYDMGWDAFKPLHPIFVATFYPTTSFGVKVEMITENAWTTKREDQNYSLVLKTGSPLATVYSKGATNFSATTRWRKTFWSGTQPGAVNIDYNFVYLKSTQTIPNYDPGVTVPASAVTAQNNLWNASDHCDVGNTFGAFAVPMDQGGGRSDIAIIPKWYVQWLYTMDPGLYGMMIGQAECGNHIFNIRRESGTGLFYDDLHTVDAFGLPISQDARPNGAPPGVGPINVANNPWCNGANCTVSHWPGFSYLPYLITGDWYFLEELQMTASSNLYFTTNGVCSYCRGGAAWGYLSFAAQTRGQAWGLRDLADAAFVSPDGTPQKTYLTQKVDYNIEIEEGEFSITAGAFPPPDATCPGFVPGTQATVKWCFGRFTLNTVPDHPATAITNTLDYPNYGNAAPNCSDPSILSSGANGCSNSESYWQYGYKWIVLGHMQELGFPVTAWNAVNFKFLLHTILDPTFNPWLVGSYTVPTIKLSTGNYYQTFADMLLTFNPAYPCTGHGNLNLQTYLGWSQDFCSGGAGASNVGAPGYPHILQGASAFLSQYNINDGALHGSDAYAWMLANVGFQSNIGVNPSFQLVPRAGGPTTFSISGTISGLGGAGATVNLTGALTQSTTADPSGNYSFPGLSAGAYTITPQTFFVYSPTSSSQTIVASNITGVNFSTTTAIAITSPTAAQSISGTAFPLTATCTQCRGVQSVEWVVDGDSQIPQGGLIFVAPWTFVWNTNFRANGPAHTVVATARDALGNTLAVSPTITFTIANTYGEPTSYISLTSVTPSIATTSPWFGVVSISAAIGGTNATNTKTIQVLVDDNYTTDTTLSASTAATQLANVDTRRYVDGPHQVCVELRDTGGTAGTLGGFPFGDWCAIVTFTNTSAAVLVNTAFNADSTATSYTSFATTTATALPNSGAVPLTAGNFALACVKMTGTSLAALSLTDTAGNSYTGLTKTDDGGQTLQCFWSNSVTANAANVYTVSSASSFSRPSIIVRQYSNVAAGNPIDASIQSSGTSAGSAPSTITSGAFTTTQNNELVTTFTAVENSGTLYVAGANYAFESQAAAGFAESQTLQATVAGATATVVTTNAISTKWQMAVVSIKTLSPVPTPSWGVVSPKEWTIAPGSTQQLTPLIVNTDNTTSTAVGPVSYTSTNTAACTVSSSGLVTGVAAAFGHCPIVTTFGNGLSETIHGYVAASNVIPHFGTDGQVHINPTPGVDVWGASMFQVTGFTSFSDPASTQAAYGNPYAGSGFLFYEGSLTDVNKWSTSQTNFVNAVDAFITTAISPLNTYGLYYYAQITPLVNGDSLFDGTEGIANTYSPKGWTLLLNEWSRLGNGRLMAVAGPDESDNGRPYPLPVSTMGADISSITCPGGGSTTWTINLTNGKGPAYNGVQQFIITGATTTSVLNTTLGGAFYPINVGSITANNYTFAGPSCGGSVTANVASDPGLIVQVFANKWYAGNDYTRYTAYATVRSEIAASTAAPPLSGEPRAIAISDPITGPSWLSWGSFEDIYEASSSVASQGNPQYSSLYDLIDPANTTSPAANFRQAAWYPVIGTPEAWMGLTGGTPVNYGFGGPTFTVSISGSTVTFPSPHGISTVYTNISKAIISGSSNSYFNSNFYIDSCPTATTCTISRATPSSTPANTPNFGTLTFANGNTWPNAKLQNTGAFTYSTQPTNCDTGSQPFLANNRNVTFTYSGSGADPYWTTNTFMFEGFPIPSNYNCQLIWHEVPPGSQTTASATLQLVNQNYTKGGGQSNPFETLQGQRKPFAGIMFTAILGATGHRMYQAGADYIINAQSGGLNNFGGASGTGCTPAQSFANCVQAGVTPLYANGDTGAVTDFFATANANLLLQRFASTGYLYAPRLGTPDVGFNIESSLRSGSKGKLLLTLNIQDGTQTHTVDLSACAIPGQSTIRYTADWTGISVAVLSPGVTLDSATWSPGGAVFYLCSNTSSLEYNQPVVGVRLADIPNATRIAVQTAYSPWQLTHTLAPSTDCGVGSACTLNVDRTIGPVYYRVFYLGSTGVLAVSDIQIL